MATAKQKAAARRNIKKAQAARRRKSGKRRRRPVRKMVRRRRRRARANPVAKTAAGRRRQRAASRRNIKKAQRARRRTRRVRSRVSAIRKAAGPGGIRVVRVKQASTPILVEEKVKPRKRRRKAATLQANPRKRRRSRKRRRRSSNAMMMENAGMTFRRRRGMLGNPEAGYGGLMRENQAFSMSALQAWGTAAAGVGTGLVIAKMLDRYVATRKPSGGNHPYFGANAAAAVNRRPDAWRLGAQAAGGLGAMALAYATRGRTFLPWLLGGTAIGFGANLFEQLANWWLMPMILKVDPAKPASLANRLYPLEQKNVQDAVDELFKNFAAAANLAANQQPGTPVVTPVLPPSGSPIYTLGRRAEQAAGKARTQAAEVNGGRVGQPVHVKTGRLGMCESCGGDGGCWSSCPDLRLCGECEVPTAQICTYTVKAGDPRIEDLVTFFCALSRNEGRGDAFCFNLNQINELNAGGPGTYWVPNNTVQLPNALCVLLSQRPMPTNGEVIEVVPSGGSSRFSPASPGANPFFRPDAPSFEVLRGTPQQNGDVAPPQQNGGVGHIPPPVQQSPSLPFHLAESPDED